MQNRKQRKRTSRWRTFSLRTFICVVTVVGVTAGWWISATQRQKEVADWIASFNRTPYYSYVLDAQGRPTLDAETPLRKWISNQFGVDSVYSIRRVHLDNRPEVKDITLLSRLHDLRHAELAECQLTDITPLGGLSKLEVISINRNEVSDISPIAGLSNLRAFSAMETPVRDITPLQRLTKLEVLELMNTEIDDVSPLANLDSLSYLGISQTRVVDISPLATLKNLEELNVSGTQVSPEMLDELQLQLPNCKITN